MYYPSSQLKTNLYTPGEEYVLLSDNSNYVGYYYETSKGKRYTGKTPNSGGDLEIILPKNPPITLEDYTTDYNIKIALFGGDPDPVIGVNTEKLYSSAMILNYRNLTSDVPVRSKPIYSQPSPTPEEFSIGEFQRYFYKKNNEYVYGETDKETFKKYTSQDPLVAWESYSIISLPWSLSGKSFSTNKNITIQAERDNRWYGFVQYFNNNFTSQISKPYSLYTRGGEYLLPNRTSYVGYYHIMPGGTYMTGKFHGDGVNVNLIELDPSLR